MPVDSTVQRPRRRVALAMLLAVVAALGLAALALVIIDFERQATWSPPPPLVAVRAAVVEGATGSTDAGGDRTFRIPDGCAVLNAAGEALVWSIVGPDDRLTVRATPVTVVGRDDGHLLVVGDLAAGDRVVADKPDQLVGGQSVRVIAPSR